MIKFFVLPGVDGQAVEISNSVDIRGELNREIAMRISSDLNSKDRFFTDLNGFQVGLSVRPHPSPPDQNTHVFAL